MTKFVDYYYNTSVLKPFDVDDVAVVFLGCIFVLVVIGRGWDRHILQVEAVTASIISDVVV